MKANELRIGNFIIESLSFGSDKVIKVDPNIFNRRIDEFIPITLTEEWLLKFGFKKKYKSYEKCDFTFLQGGFDKLAYKLTIIENTPKYVHQLQNLYFALTGEELTFKEE